MEKMNWKVEGMTCSNCALSIQKYLEKEGMVEVFVNPIGGDVSFKKGTEMNEHSLIDGISKLGYTVVKDNSDLSKNKKWLHNNKQRFWITMPFTTLLMMHMFHEWMPLHWISNPLNQLLLCSPVFLLGMWIFGRNAWMSIKSGVPNMNVLIALGAVTSFTYSVIGWVYFDSTRYLFFETTASIISLVFLGNYLEEATIQSTQKALKTLVKSQKVIANMIVFDDQHQELIFPIENNQLKVGDLILIKTGEQVPIDCKILWGDCLVNESIVTGEIIPVSKTKKDFLIGGSLLESGIIKAQVTKPSSDTVIAGILQMIHTAQTEKPRMQQLADRISAVFVPLIIIIAIITFILNYTLFYIPLSDSLMRAIAVLVISCPCAMGLATPAAIAVGLGRAAKKGILFKKATGLEQFKNIKQIVFDKTGTLTTGQFDILRFHTSIDEMYFKSLVFSMEKYSNHPIAKSITKKWGDAQLIHWKKIEEIKGVGLSAEDHSGNQYFLGLDNRMSQHTSEEIHDMYLLKNNESIGWIDIKDEVRAESVEVIKYLNDHGILTIMLTGDSVEKATIVGNELKIKRIIAKQSPNAKMEMIGKLNAEKPTAMVGDGINDAPALAKAAIGISISDASQLAIQQADVILMNQGLKNLPEALGIGKHTFITIKQNLYWAFAYNILAIPVAAMGLLTPTFSAMAMGFSDIVLAGISLQLFIKKVI